MKMIILAGFGSPFYFILFLCAMLISKLQNDMLSDDSLPAS